MAELTILTYNLFSDLPRFRHLDRRLTLAAQAIAAKRPDLIALQEITHARACGDLGQRLCSKVNELVGCELYELHFARADGAGEGEWAFEEGIALMARLVRVGEVEMLRYKAQVALSATVGGQSYRLPDDRVAMHSRHRTVSDTRVDFYLTHLTDGSAAVGGATVRAAQARELIHWIAATTEPRNLVVVAGDFNDAPESETLAVFARAGFTDMYAAAGEMPGYTNHSGDLELTSPHERFNQRIDYLLMRTGTACNPGVVEARLFLDRPSHEPDGSWLWASDHTGVLARLAL